MVKTVDETITRMKVIRETVKQNKDLTHCYFGEYYELITNLRILDPDNPELDISINSLPYGGI